MDAQLEATLDRYHEGLRRFAVGDPAPVLALFTRRDDVTLANPFGPAQRGGDAVAKAAEAAATHYREGTVAFERVSGWATPDLAYVHEVERYHARIDGRPAEVELRVTTILRREDAAWRIVHRHADPITTPRGAESLSAH